MLYFRVKKEYDLSTRYYERPDHRLRENGVLIANELYTLNERAKIRNGRRYFEEVEIPKSKIYFMFGARFATEK